MWKHKGQTGFWIGSYDYVQVSKNNYRRRFVLYKVTKGMKIKDKAVRTLSFSSPQYAKKIGWKKV